MRTLRLAALALLLALSTSAADGPLPEWSKMKFSTSPDRVYAAALKSIAAQHHRVTSRDEANKVIGFHIGPTLWVWGYDMLLRIHSGENNSSDVSIEIAPHATDVFGGSGKKEVRKVLNGIRKELVKGSTTTSL
jgi:hypothetical protein